MRRSFSARPRHVSYTTVHFIYIIIVYHVLVFTVPANLFLLSRGELARLLQHIVFDILRCDESVRGRVFVA